MPYICICIPTQQSYDEPRIKKYSESITSQHCQVMECSSMPKSGSLVSPDGSADVKSKMTHLQNIVKGCGYTRRASKIVESNRRYQIPVCWSQNGNPFKATGRCRHWTDRGQENPQLHTKNKLLRKRYIRSNSAVHPKNFIWFCNIRVTCVYRLVHVICTRMCVAYRRLYARFVIKSQHVMWF